MREVVQSGRTAHVPVELFDAYEASLRVVYDACEARMALDSWPRLVNKLGEEAGIHNTPLFMYVGPAFTRTFFHETSSVANKQVVCEAVLAAMGRYIKVSF